MLFLTRKYRPLLGLDITTSSVKLIELVNSGGTYRVESYAAEPTPQNAMNEKAIVDAEAVGEAIRRAVKRSGAGAKEVAIAISGAIGIFHAGVELGWWEGITRCTAAGGASLQDILSAPLVRCDQVQWAFLGISMAGWNASLSLSGAALIAVLTLKDRRA